MVCAPTEGHADVQDPCYHQMLCKYPCSLLLSEAMLMSMGCAANGRPREFLRSMLSLEDIWKFMMHVAADCKRQGSFFCSDFDNFRLTVENERHRSLLGQPFSYPPLPIPKEKKGIYWRELLKTVIEMLKCKLFKVDGSWVGKTQLSPLALLNTLLVMCFHSRLRKWLYKSRPICFVTSAAALPDAPVSGFWKLCLIVGEGRGNLGIWSSGF